MVVNQAVLADVELYYDRAYKAKAGGDSERLQCMSRGMRKPIYELAIFQLWLFSKPGTLDPSLGACCSRISWNQSNTMVDFCSLAS